MATISITTPSDGTTIDAADVSTPLNTIVNEINGNLSNANIASGAAIAGSKLADASVTNAKLATGAGEPGGAWNSWTPSWTNVTIGNATVVAKYKQIGKTVHVRMHVTIGSGTSVSGTIIWSQPVTSIDYTTARNPFNGQMLIFDTSIGSFYACVPSYATTTTARALVGVASASFGTFADANNTTPVAPATGDVWTINYSYEAA